MRSNETLTFFSLRGYPRASLIKDLRRITTIKHPDALHPSEPRVSTIDRVPFVLVYHPFNKKIKRFLFQNFRTLSIEQPTRHIFSQPPVVAYKHDLSLPNVFVHSTDHARTAQRGSRACQHSRCHTCAYVSPETEVRGPRPASAVTLYTSYPVPDVSPEKPDAISGVVLANTYEVYETTLHSISDIRIRVCSYATVLTSKDLQRKPREVKLIFQLGTVQPDGLNINFNFISK